MSPSDARTVVEQLRKGIPPEGYVRHFTVGRNSEIAALTKHLERGKAGALLLRANYGSGKSHLLRFVRETALDEGFAVSSVTLDANSAVRFNRMDQILGGIWRGLEVPGVTCRGARPLLDLACNAAAAANGMAPNSAFWHELTNDGRWTLSTALEAPAMFLALRAWSTGRPALQAFVEDWLYQPWSYQSQRKRLYSQLIEAVRPRYVDPRPEWMFYNEGVFMFNTQGYHQSWAALRDMDVLAKRSGLKGLVVLVDEFEDVLTNLRRIDYQESAFWNLFSFYEGKRFSGLSFFAVTPGFAEKCMELLVEKERWEFDVKRFRRLPTFEMSPLEVPELEELGAKILAAHGLAYRWDPQLHFGLQKLRQVVRTAAHVRIQDRSRHVIREVVKALDDGLDRL